MINASLFEFKFRTRPGSDRIPGPFCHPNGLQKGSPVKTPHRLNPLVRPVLALMTLMLALVPIGCDDSDSHSRNDAPPVVNGDASGALTAPLIAGLDYTVDGETGVTNAEGGFFYVDGAPVRFSIGALRIAEIDPAPVMTFKDVKPGDRAAVNLIRFLWVLDEDETPDNGIQVPSNLRDRAVDRPIDWDVAARDFDAEIAPVLADFFGDDPPALMDGEKTAETLMAAVRSLTTTTRDDKGVWFIQGAEESPYSVFEAMGYAVAVDRLWQAELYRRSARGRLAEIFGPGQLETDIFMRTIGYSDAELAAGFEALDHESRVVITAYVDGFNRRIGEIAEDPAVELPFEFAAIGQQLGVRFLPEPWTVEDVLAWTALMLRQFDPEALNQGQLDNARLYAQLTAAFPEDGAVLFNDLRWENDAAALTYIAPTGEGPDSRIAARPPAVSRAPLSGPDIPNAERAAEASQAVADRLERVFANLSAINARVRMGSYAWVVSGDKTASGEPILYSGPQMGFSVPSIVMEGSVAAGGFQVSGMAVPGLPGIIIGRTPHHAWSMQVGHARTVDYYLESPDAVALHRVETIQVAGGQDVTLPVYRTVHGPVINPIPYDPETYQPSQDNPIVSWRYAHWGHEFESIAGMVDLARARSMDDFGAGIDRLGVSQHFCYADRDGDIAYWMSGRDPIRPDGEYRLPQGMTGDPAEYDADNLRPRSTQRNPAKGYFGGWNNKTAPEYGNAYNNLSYYFGPFHRAHVVDAFLAARDDLTFEAVRDLALDIATTDSFGRGGNPWAFVEGIFSDAAAAASTTERDAAVALLAEWDGHFVAGGPEEWVDGTDRADAWMLMDAWLRETLRLVFEDELGTQLYDQQPDALLFNVFLRAVRPDLSVLANGYDWMTNRTDESAPQVTDAIIVQALDNALADLGQRPWGEGERGTIAYDHDLIGQVHETPFASRSTYAHCVAFDAAGPSRIESMFPLGQSGDIRMGVDGEPVFDDHFFSMTPLFDAFAHRSFPVFEP